MGGIPQSRQMDSILSRDVEMLALSVVERNIEKNKVVGGPTSIYYCVFLST